MSATRIPRFVPRAGTAAVVLALLVAACGGEPDRVGTGNAGDKPPSSEPPPEGPVHASRS